MVNKIRFTDDKLSISKKKKLKGEDGYKVFSVRIKDETIRSLEEISDKTGRSRNELINLFLEFGLSHYEIEE